MSAVDTNKPGNSFTRFKRTGPVKYGEVQNKRIPVYRRKHAGAPVQIRPGLAQDYELEKSHKETWWRTCIRETPKPSHYGVETTDTFIKDIHQSRHSYNFKSNVRRTESRTTRRGQELLPGAYTYRDFVEEMSKSIPPKTYSFKNTARGKKGVLNEGLPDKDINVSPNQYRTEVYEATCITNPHHKNYMFKSATKRFPTAYFAPKSGPSPSYYKPRRVLSAPAISSSFRSLTPRFKSSISSSPGPGMYEPTLQSPQTRTLEQMGRKYGVFFSCAFN